jgi:class 3 adenylate cyclase/tetratricopeptide (TPR) repeat protein
MQCPNCQHQNTPTAKFCENCGFKLQTTDNRPQTTMVGDQSAVSNPQSPDVARLEKLVPKEFAQRLLQSRTGKVEGERRIVTILFCDVKGSTALGDERDPEEILEIMNGAFDALIEPVYRYEGTLARLMGDAILAFFGAPIAHEDDPERACLAALAMQEKIAQYARKVQRTRGIENFAVRVGINTGLVVVGEVGSDLRVEYTAMGDAINLASRMEQAAEPGTIVIAENTARLARHAMELVPLGALAVKGKAEPVNAYRVVGVKAHRESQRGIVGLTSPLVGRAYEFNLLQERVNDVLNGRGQIVAVIGEAGLGKSRLVAELRKARLETRDSKLRSASDAFYRTNLYWFEARALSYETQTPYAPFVDLFRQIVDIHVGDADAEAYAKLKTKLHELVGAQTDALAPFLATLMGIGLTGEDLERVRYLMPPFLRGRIMQATAQVIGALAAQQPTVIVFEDLHWADTTSLEMLGELLPMTEQAPLLFLLLLRPNKTDPAWQLLEQIRQTLVSRFSVLELQPLNEAASRELVANLLEIEDLPASVRALILQKAEGNPFYVEEVIRSLLDQKLVVRDGNRWRATREISNLTIPDTLAGVITARLDRLDEESKRTAQTASVLGREFEYAPLLALYEAPVSLEPALEILQARELVRRKSTERSPQPSYLFKHALTQETAYHSMLLAKRRALHKRAAAYLEQQEPDRVNEIARHWLDAQENARALPFVLEAADRAARAYATTEAIAYYTRAKDIARQIGDVPTLRRAYEGLGGALTFTTELPRAVSVFQEMLDAGQAHGDVLMQISALNKQANVLSLRMGQVEQAEPLLLEAERLAREYQDKVGLGEMFVIRCQISVGRADFDTAMRYIGSAVQVGKELNVQEQILWGLAHLTSAYTFMLRFDEAEKVAAEGLAMAFDLDNREFYADIKTTQALLHWRRGDLDAAIAAGEEAADIGDRIGLSMMVVFGACGAGWVYWQRGEYSAAANVLQTALRAAEPFRGFMPFMVVMSKAPLGSVMLEAGMDRASALAYHKDALALSESPVGGMSNGGAWADIGWCAVNLGDFELAQKLFERALDFASFFRLVMRPRNLLGLAELAKRRGDFDAAQKYIDQARALADEHAMRPYQALVALAEGQLDAARGAHERALARLDEAETRAASMRMRPTLLEARLTAATSLRALGRASEADEKRAQARAVMNEIAAFISDTAARRTYLEDVSQRFDW